MKIGMEEMFNELSLNSNTCKDNGVLFSEVTGNVIAFFSAGRKK